MQSYDTRFAFQIQKNHPNFSYESQILEIYRGFFNQNTPVEIVSEKDPLLNFQVVIVPSLYILSAETCKNLEKFAEAGGIVVFLPRTGVKDMYNGVVNTKLPGLAAKMCGIEIDDIVSLADEQSNQVQFCLPELNETFVVSTLADLIEPKGAEIIATYVDDYYANFPAATIHTYGFGKVVYLGIMGDSSLYSALARWLTGLAGISGRLSTPLGVEVVNRWRGDTCLTFILNHLAEEQAVNLGFEYQDLLSGQILSGDVSIPPYGILVLKD